MTKEEFLAMAESHYSEIESLKEAPTLYDYENALFELMQKACGEIMEKHLNEGSVTENRRKKKR